MGGETEPIWMADDEAATISAQSVALFGGLSGEVRDENLLKAAMARPLHKWHYDEPKPDIFTLAAAYCFGLVKGHPFHDGNKRTAYLVAIIFLELNGYECAPDQTNIISTILAAADGSIGEDQLAGWFAANSTVSER
ncbi:MAG: type II toxin-antitoxin system death-on-curing family toxin [Rhodospirillaceae bacterium]|nr:type II toxin-antitoxin system death-on-curing family toxin [Rhodospirillaceae bacterium]